MRCLDTPTRHISQEDRLNCLAQTHTSLEGWVNPFWSTIWWLPEQTLFRNEVNDVIQIHQPNVSHKKIRPPAQLKHIRLQGWINPFRSKLFTSRHVYNCFWRRGILWTHRLWKDAGGLKVGHLIGVGCVKPSGIRRAIEAYRQRRRRLEGGYGRCCREEQSERYQHTGDHRVRGCVGLQWQI